MHCFESLGNIGVHQPAILPSLVAVFPEQGVGSSLDDIRSRILEYSKRSLTFETDTFRAIFGQENEILSHGDSENIPRLLHIQTWVAKVVARFVPALGRNVYPTWMFKLAPGGTTFCPFANQGLDVDMELNMDSESDSTTTNVIYCPPARQEQIVNLDIKDGLAGILEFAWAINDIPSNEAGPVVPELVAVVMSACETGLVALLVTPVVGTDHYEFCGVRRFRFYPAHDLEEIDVWPGEEDTPLKSPFPSVDIDALHDDDEFETFTHHRIEFEWREIVLG
ncbi:hypothetical protein N0V93_004527 [Gnomoniopsis smithogilvyi]|uniref:Uncharacterized protein n=1 Tax=Gnomoniopsis smithogilvyi TaxID=1191159 RepID=A0A9W8YSK3_9PEZI|nr:hypothetical protein N0V93_004527 [Gnomoniopsis smithogilvyi]